MVSRDRRGYIFDESDAIFYDQFQFAVGRAFRGLRQFIFVAEHDPDMIACNGGFCEAEPILGRFFPFLREDLDDVAGLQFVVQRHERSVHFRADARIADLGMDVIGEIHRRRFRGKINDVALRRHGEDPVLEEIHFHCLEHLGGVGRVSRKMLLPGLELLDPRQFFGEFFAG